MARYSDRFHPKAQRYRKTATVLAYQLPVGQTEKFDTLEGPVTVSGPDWKLTAHTARAEQWPSSDAYFTGPYGYEPTGEVVGGLREYRKKPSADVWAYQVDTDDHPPVQGMQHLDEPFVPPRGYWVAWQMDGSHVRAIEERVFATTYAPSDDA